MKNKHSINKAYIATYSAIFLVVSIAVFTIFNIAGKSFVWDPDGLRQHYTTLSYIGKYLRGIIRGKGAPMMDFKIGQGFDVLTTLNYYGVGDPLNLLAVFVRQKHIEILYTLLIFVRLYLAGIAFSWFCFSINKKEHGPVLIGTICYVFSGFGVYCSVRHPFFINAMLYLPLLLIACERILKKKKYGFFSCMVGLSLISNFYFAYMNTIFVGIYLLFRIFALEQGTFVDKLKLIGKITVAYIVGVMISAIVFLPVVYAFLQNARGGDGGGYTDSMLFYQAKYYQKYLSYFAAPKMFIDSWTIGGYSPICLISALYLLFIHRKELEEKKQIRVAKLILVLLLIFSLVPIFGKIFNGFGYVCNRWCYALVMVNAVVVVYALPRLLTMTKKEMVGLLAVLTTYIVLMLVCCKEIDFELIVGVGFIVGIYLILWILNDTEKQSIRSYIALTSIVVIAVLSQITIIFSPDYGKYIGSFCDEGKVYEFSGRSAINRMAAVKDKDFYRVEQPWIDKSNQSMVRNYHGNTYYWSLVPSTMPQYLDDLGVAALDRKYACLGFDSRLILNELGATKYYVARETNSGIVPFGYEHQKQYDKKDFRVYRNKYALSIGYGLQRYMRKSEYDKLLPIQKQEALLSCAIVNDVDVNAAVQNGIDESASDNIELKSKEIPYKIETTKGIKLSKGKIKVVKKNAKMTITYQGNGKGENYMLFHNIRVKTGVDHELISVSKKHCFYSKLSLFPKGNPVYYEKPYYGIKIVNEKGENKITLKFKKKKVFTYDWLKLYNTPMDNYEKQVTDLKENKLEDVTIKSNRISGNVDLNSDRWMQFAIPYSIGWKAYVDGKKTALYASDTTYLGMNLTKGKHSIVLTYETPYIKMGAIISALGCMLVIVSMFWKRKKENQ